MELKEVIEKAKNVKAKYSKLEESLSGRAWTREQDYIAFVKDVGELGEIIMAKEGIRKGENIDERLGHELSDCLFSIIILADKYGINLEQEFLKTMRKLEEKLSSIS